MEAGFRENSPGEEEENADDDLDDGKEPPGGDVGEGRVSRAWLRSLEELGGHAVLEKGPVAHEFSENDRDEGDRVFETRAIIYGLRVLVHHEQAYYSRGDRDYSVSTTAVRSRRKTKDQ